MHLCLTVECIASALVCICLFFNPPLPPPPATALPLPSCTGESKGGRTLRYCNVSPVPSAQPGGKIRKDYLTRGGALPQPKPPPPPPPSSTTLHICRCVPHG